MRKKIIVIGAGILGASTAYYLAKQGADVIIIDNKQKGQATDAAAGIVCPWISQRRNKAWYTLAKNGARLYPELIRELAIDGEMDTGYAQVGAISLHTDEKKLIAMRERTLKRLEDAPEIGEVTILDSEQTRSLFPILSDSYRAVHVSGAARVDGRKLRNALLQTTTKYGATSIDGNAHLLKDGTNIIGVSVNDQMIEADAVIAATGAWMNELFLPLNIVFDVVPQKAQIIHVQLPNTDASNWPVVMPPSSQYMLSFDDRIIIGTTHEDDVGFDSRITVGGIHEILDQAIELAPALSNATILEARVGFRPFTPGFLPVIGALPGFDGLYTANGLGSSGLTMGPYIGKQLANLALGKEIDINLSDYDVAGALK